MRDYQLANLQHARATMIELVRDGYHFGPILYGYRTEQVRVMLGNGRTRRLRRLTRDPRRAKVVPQIFTWHTDNELDAAEIARCLAARPRDYPPPLRTRTRRPHRWNPAAVRAILRDPRYTGFQVWARHRADGTLAPPREWIVSDTWAHPALIDGPTFHRVHTRHMSCVDNGLSWCRSLPDPCRIAAAQAREFQ